MRNTLIHPDIDKIFFSDITVALERSLIVVIHNVYTRELRFAVSLDSVNTFESILRTIFTDSSLEHFIVRDRGPRICTCLFLIRLERDACAQIISNLRGYATSAKLKLFLDHIADDIDLAVFGAPREDFSIAA